MPFLIPLIALVAGVLLGNYLDGPLWGAIPVGLALCLYWFLIKKNRIPFNALRLNNVHHVWILFLFLGIGLFSSWYNRSDELAVTTVSSVVGGEGEVLSVKSYSSSDCIDLKIYNLVTSGGEIIKCNNLKILLWTDGFSTKQGDVLLFKGNLQTIVDNPNYRSSGYAERMRRSGYLYKSTVNSECIRIKSFNNSFRTRSAVWRDKIEIALEKSSLDKATSDFLIAFLLGDKSFLSTRVKESFSNAGVAHVLALSGMHVAIVSGIFLFLLFPFALIGWHVPRYWIAIFLIWIFAFLTGLAPSTVRACIMSTFVVLSITFQRRKNSGNALLASSMLIILLDPSAIYDVGMQLSFLCVACILMFASQLNPVNQRLHPKLHLVSSSILVSLSATLGTWVLVSFYFKRIPMLFLPANLVLLPFLPPYMAVGLIYTILLLNGYDPVCLSWILDKGYLLFVSIINLISDNGNYTIDFQATLPMVLIWLLGILILGYAIHRKKKIASIVVSLLLLTVAVSITPLLTATPSDSIIFQKRYQDIAMMVYKGNTEKLSVFPRNTISRVSDMSSDVFSIDCSGFIDSIPIWLNTTEQKLHSTGINSKVKRRKRYMLLSSVLGDISLKEIPYLDKFDKIILHPSLRKAKEKSLINEAKELGLTTVHSLRIEGPLEIDL